MIPKAERDADRAIIVYANPGSGATVAQYDAAIDHASERLPLYIAALDEMEKRINAIERMLALTCEEAKEDPSGEDEWSRGHRSTLRGVVKILRGEK